ncbi:MAG: hypothetical protein HY283_04055, partial [Nitrospirae bacterium]|nr:hypothetical protein [Nitrospirota bacterium]
APASASFNTPMICSSVCRLRVMLSPPACVISGPDSTFNWPSFRGEGQKDDPSIIFQIGNHKLNPVSRIIDENKKLDLVTIDLTGIDVDQLSTLPNVGSSFHEPSRWPPAEVKQGNFVLFGGFPWKWRKQLSPIDFEFGIFSSGACHVTSVSEDHIMCRFEREHWISSWQEGPPLDLHDLGGLSGSPVFVIRPLFFEFIGITREFSPGLDSLEIRIAKYLNAAGSKVSGG